MNDHYVINLGRQLGSGGKEIGEAVMLHQQMKAFKNIEHRDAKTQRIN